MNQEQYQILKMLTNFPQMNLRKLAKLIKLDYMTVLRVQTTNTYEDALNKDLASYDAMRKAMGLGF